MKVDTAFVVGRAAVQSAGSRLAKQSVPLFVGGVFDQTYNQRAPLIMQTPPSMSQALLFVSITGLTQPCQATTALCVDRAAVEGRS